MSRWARALPAILFVLLMGVVYADPLFLRRNFAGRDLIPYGLPLEKVVHDAYSRGRLPVWNPHVSGGRPLLPNPNTGAFYPLRPLLSVLPFPMAMRTYPVLHWAAAGVGIILLLQKLGVSRAAMWIGAVSYVFSGVIVSEVFYTILQPGATLLPWIVWALVRPSRGARKVLLLAILFALLMLAGDVFSTSLALIACVLWIFLETERRARVGSFRVLGLSIGLALLLAAPQVLATALLVPETNRAVLGMKLSEVLLFSLSPWRLVELIVPYPFGNTWSLDLLTIWGRGTFRSFFANLYCGAFALLALAEILRRSGPGARFVRGLALLSVVLSAGGTLVPAAWGSLPSPIPLRYPEKFSVGLILALAVASGLALDRVRASGGPRRGALGVGILLTILAAAASVFPQASGRLAAWAVGAAPRFAAEAGQQLPAALAEGGLLWIATLVALDLLRRPGRVRLAVALLLLTAVPIAANRKIAHITGEDNVFPPTPFALTLARLDPAGSYRTIDESRYRPPGGPVAWLAIDPDGSDFFRRAWYLHTQTLWGRGSVFNSDLDVGDLSRVESLRRVSSFAAAQADDGSFFGSLALRFGIRFRDQQPLPGYRRFGGDALQNWDENPRALPDIRLAERWREEGGALTALQAFPRLAEGEIVIETGSVGQGRARRGEIRILERSPERLEILAAAADPTWLFVLRGFWRYRRVYLDGQQVEFFPAQLAFSAIRVPEGKHRIQWQECVPGGEISWCGPALFVLGALWLPVRDRLNRKKRLGSVA